MNTQDVVVKVKNGIAKLSEQKVRELVNYYTDLFYVSYKGKVLSSMESDLNQLLAEMPIKIPSFVETIFNDVKDNPFIMEQFSVANSKDVEEAFNKYVYSDERAAEIAIFAYVLQCSVDCIGSNKAAAREYLRAMTKNKALGPKVLFNVLKREKSIFLPVKMMSVYVAAVYIVFEGMFKFTSVDIARALLQVNILEAVIADFVKGNWANSLAGFVLTITTLPPGLSSSKSDKNYKKEISEPNIDNWVKFYNAWNSCFIQQRKSYPFAITILNIPALSDANNARHFPTNRTFSLLMYLCAFSQDKFLEKAYNPGYNEPKINKKFNLAALKNTARYIVDRKIALP